MEVSDKLSMSNAQVNMLGNNNTIHLMLNFNGSDELGAPRLVALFAPHKMLSVVPLYWLCVEKRYRVKSFNPFIVLFGTFATFSRSIISS